MAGRSRSPTRSVASCDATTLAIQAWVGPHPATGAQPPSPVGRVVLTVLVGRIEMEACSLAVALAHGQDGAMAASRCPCLVRRGTGGAGSPGVQAFRGEPLVQGSQRPRRAR
jgi:hypothetical protein